MLPQKGGSSGILRFEGEGVHDLVYEVPGLLEGFVGSLRPDGDAQTLLTDGLSLSIQKASSQG